MTDRIGLEKGDRVLVKLGQTNRYGKILRFSPFYTLAHIKFDGGKLAWIAIEFLEAIRQ